mmetsp:Transcript_11355/g.32118  ORF Transcript_11355/g.32118 Transcript_11355/m.32118 type:complete len:263 (+) Transcript_11355:1574-2362(+)
MEPAPSTPTCTTRTAPTLASVRSTTSRISSRPRTSSSARLTTTTPVALSTSMATCRWIGAGTSKRTEAGSKSSTSGTITMTTRTESSRHLSPRPCQSPTTMAILLVTPSSFSTLMATKSGHPTLERSSSLPPMPSVPPGPTTLSPSMSLPSPMAIAMISFEMAMSTPTAILLTGCIPVAVLFTPRAPVLTIRPPSPPSVVGLIGSKFPSTSTLVASRLPSAASSSSKPGSVWSKRSTTYGFPTLAIPTAGTTRRAALLSECT